MGVARLDGESGIHDRLAATRSLGKSESLVMFVAQSVTMPGASALSAQHSETIEFLARTEARFPVRSPGSPRSLRPIGRSSALCHLVALVAILLLVVPGFAFGGFYLLPAALVWLALEVGGRSKAAAT